MALTLDNLIAGPVLPEKEVYIESLQDTVLITPVPLKRYKQYGDITSPEGQQELIEVCVAESLSKQSGMTLSEAKELNERVSSNLHPAAWDEISNAVLITMFGESRVNQASAQSGNV
jgi:hypothetical protein